jgi:hypothetical protein
MPVNVSHVWNSCYAQQNLFGLGIGWQTNMNQLLWREDESTYA